MTHLQRLLDIMETLRSENGCPWDREQTLTTLRPYAVEEVYEVIDAIDRGDVEDHCEELGDLLLQVVFQAQLRKEEGAFDFEDVAQAIADKLIRRHPHVFGDGAAENAAEVIRNWNAIKAQEKAHRAPPASRLAKVPVALPGLLKAQELQKTAAKAGFDWPETGPVMDKVREEMDEVTEALAGGQREAVAAEFGDLLFAMVNLGRHLGVDCEQALQDACSKFRRRFAGVETAAVDAGQTLEAMTLAEMDAIWDAVKAAEAHE